MFKKRNGEETPADGGSGTPVPATASASSQQEPATAEQPATQASPPPPPATEQQPAAEQPAEPTPAPTSTKEKPVDEKKVKEKKAKPAKDGGSATKEKSERKPGQGWSVDRVRTAVGRVVWLVCVLAAVALALSALMFALDFKESNPLVNFFYELADGVDLGVFDVDNPLRTFRTDGQVDLTKITLLNYGVGAVVYLVAGRVLERVIRP